LAKHKIGGFGQEKMWIPLAHELNTPKLLGFMDAHSPKIWHLHISNISFQWSIAWKIIALTFFSQLSHLILFSPLKRQ
jgi:hypothetical protein